MNVRKLVPVAAKCAQCGWQLPKALYVQAPTMMQLPETGLVRVQCPTCGTVHLASWFPAPPPTPDEEDTSA